MKETNITPKSKSISRRRLGVALLQLNLLTLPPLFTIINTKQEEIVKFRQENFNLNERLPRLYQRSILITGIWGSIWSGLKGFGKGVYNIPMNIYNSVRDASWLKWYGTFFGIAALTLEIITLSILFKKTSVTPKREKTDADLVIEDKIKEEEEEKAKQQKDKRIEKKVADKVKKSKTTSAERTKTKN